MGPAWCRGIAAGGLLCLVAACGGTRDSSPAPCSTASSPEATAAAAQLEFATAMSLGEGPQLTYLFDMCGHPDLGATARRHVLTAIDSCFSEPSRRAAAHLVFADSARVAQCGLTRTKDVSPARLNACRDLEQKLPEIRARMEAPIDCAGQGWSPDSPPTALTPANPEPPK
jgi:hypothetical protein